ncbi:7-deoxyloganetin glucosyltransferase-like [Tasmannia lanceolata]|uniref:7-deoxyloganetin glucosyltransferase-like n=1 Tax=Tasmannia lanceolata TaxID=3420 RepID=UPI004063A551
MGSLVAEKPHIVFVPFPSQGHINPLFQLAKILHSNGFYITFVNTEYNHQRLVSSRGQEAVKGLDDFRFETISDGLDSKDFDRTQDLPAVCNSMLRNSHLYFLELLKKLNGLDSRPHVTCVIADGAMGFTMKASEELGIPEFVFYTPSACGVAGYFHYRELVDKGYIPLKDENCFTNGYLDTTIDFIPGMEGFRLKDLPTFIRTTNHDDIMLNYDLENSKNAFRAKGMILNTFEDLEWKVVDGIRNKFSLDIFTIGPLVDLYHQMSDSRSKSIGSNLWKEDTECLDWLDQRAQRSVIYVNFGSIVIMTAKQLIEFAWGLAKSKQSFLWVIRPDLVRGESAVLMEDFFKEVEGRGFFPGWCPQEQVLAHPSIGGFLTHCGWNSLLESICGRVPMICWTFCGEQPTNCRFACREWGIGMEVSQEVKREQVDCLVRELMEGEKGKEMRKKAREWKESAERATKKGGSSYMNLENLIKELRL